MSRFPIYFSLKTSCGMSLYILLLPSKLNILHAQPIYIYIYCTFDWYVCFCQCSQIIRLTVPTEVNRHVLPQWIHCNVHFCLCCWMLDTVDKCRQSWALVSSFGN